MRMERKESSIEFTSALTRVFHAMLDPFAPADIGKARWLRAVLAGEIDRVLPIAVLLPVVDPMKAALARKRVAVAS
jgi:hypothetical protein